MEKFVKVLLDTAPVSDAEANDAFGLLVPIVEIDPASADAGEAARNLIGRCLLKDDHHLAYLLDWWYVATTGEPTANGGAHLLPQSLDESVRVPMEATMQLGVEMPAAEWLDKRRQFEQRLRDLDNVLNLEHHGPVKLLGERPAWAWFRDRLTGAADAMRANRRADFARPEIEGLQENDFKKQLRNNGVDKGSRREKEMLSRFRETLDFITKTLDLQVVVEPWKHREVPELLTELPAGFADSVGPLSSALLRPVLSATAAPSVNRADLGRQLEAAARSSDEPGRYRLARIALRWCEETGQQVEALSKLMERHQSLLNALKAVEHTPGLDTDEVHLYAAEDDIDGAEAALQRIRDQMETQGRRQLNRSQFEGLRHKLEEAGLGDDDDWQGRLSEIKTRLDTEDPHEMSRQMGTAQRQLDEELDAELSERLEVLGAQYDTLRSLGALDTLLFDFKRQIEEIKSSPGGRGANELRLALEAEASQLRTERRKEVVEHLASIERILTTESEDFSEADRGFFANRHSEIDSLLDDAEMSDFELMAARSRAKSLLQRVDDQRIYRWKIRDGETCLVEHIVSYCTRVLDFQDEDIKRLHAALKTKPFVILAGLTGSGKSSLTRLYAEAVGAQAGNGQFRRIAVRPDWIDQSEVLGFVNPMSQRFVPGWLAETVRSCELNAERLHFVLLDEMNLAPVEQYLAELLSAMEEARSGSLEVRLPLYAPGENPINADEWPPVLSYPDNLLIVGTVNVDETTRPLSERVIDRANVLQLSVEVSERHHRTETRPATPWLVTTAEWRAVRRESPSNEHHQFLVDIADILRQANIGVGLRAHVELERFVANAVGVLDPVAALDWGIVQRIIPKIRGFKGPLSAALEDLLDEFNKVGAVESAAIIGRWLDERVSDDEYLDGTDPRLTLART